MAGLQRRVTKVNNKREILGHILHIIEKQLNHEILAITQRRPQSHSLALVLFDILLELAYIDIEEVVVEP